MLLVRRDPRLIPSSLKLFLFAEDFRRQNFSFGLDEPLVIKSRFEDLFIPLSY